MDLLRSILEHSGHIGSSPPSWLAKSSFFDSSLGFFCGRVNDYKI